MKKFDVNNELIKIKNKSCKNELKYLYTTLKDRASMFIYFRLNARKRLDVSCRIYERHDKYVSYSSEPNQTNRFLFHAHASHVQ